MTLENIFICKVLILFYIHSPKNGITNIFSIVLYITLLRDINIIF